MRLDRKPIAQKSAGSKRDPIAEKMGTPTWGSEERRAAAGIFYLSSTISKLLDKMNTFQCTQFIEEGCLTLQQQAEYRTDKDLYHVIRLQRIIESIDKIADSSASDDDAHSSYVRVRSELEDFRVHLCSDVSDSHLLFMQFHTAKLFLYQVAFFERNLQHSPALHLNILCEGLEGAKSFLDLYMWLPPKSEMALTNTEWIQLSFGVTLAAKFAIVSKEPNVELHTQDLRHRLNIDHVLRHLVLRIGALVGRAGGGDKRKDIFFHYEQRTRKIQKWYERMKRATGADIPNTPPTPYQSVSSTHQQMSIPTSQTPIPSVSSTTISDVPLSATFRHQQPQSYSQEQSQLQPQHSYTQPNLYTLPTTLEQQAPLASMGMIPMSSYESYSPTPSIAFPDLMNAHGWDNMFSIPMEHDALIFDVSQGYGLGMASPHSDTTSSYESPPAQ